MRTKGWTRASANDGKSDDVLSAKRRSSWMRKIWTSLEKLSLTSSARLRHR
jgi:hypothetical protein